MKNILLLLCFLFWTIISYSKEIPKDCKIITNNLNSCKWKFFSINNSIEAEIIMYDPPMGACTRNNYAGVAIIRYQSDTIRVILPCINFRTTLKTGSIVTLIPCDSSFKHIILPLHKDDSHTNYKRSVYFTNCYDTIIRNTIWAHLTDTTNQKKHFYHSDNPLNLATSSFSFHWNIIARNGTTSGEIIKFNNARGKCGIHPVAAVAIIKRKLDTIRVILPCHNKLLYFGSNVNIEIINPTNQSIIVPQDVKYSIEQEKKKLHLYRVNEYDEIVTKTIYGVVSE